MIFPPLPPSNGISDLVRVTLYFSFSIYVRRRCSFEDDYEDDNFEPASISILSPP